LVVEEKNRRSALVLEGGGAKGAYQLGALLALDAAGLRFDVVTGSSVGALNGLLVTTDQLGIGLDYWWNMSFGNVLSFRVMGIIRLLLEPAYLAARLVGTAIIGEFADPSEGIGLGLGAATFYILLSAPIALIIFVLSKIFHFSRITVFYPLGIALLALVLYTILSLPYLVREANLSLFRPSPLRKLIEQVLKSRRMDSLIITLTETLQRLDPDYPHIAAQPIAQGLNELVAIPGPTHVPRYFAVSELPMTSVCNALLASAALPEGIFPSVRIDGSSYIDGGVSDNLPLYPALSAGRIHDLVVIRLNPGSETFLKKHWQRKERLQRIRTLSVEEGRRLRFKAWPPPTERGLKYDPPIFIPFVEPPYWPESVVVIAPDSSLGNFLSGTLNFRRSKARELILRGWRDARKVLGNSASLPEEPPLQCSMAASTPN
jgi:predicted acylesterase/phospholipase RssA